MPRDSQPPEELRGTPRNPRSPTLPALERWLQESSAAAERLLPSLLDLSGPELLAELERHRELRPAVVKLLLALVHDHSARCPERACELTAAIVAPSLWSPVEAAGADAQPSRVRIERYLRGQAWTAHAAALRGLGRHAEAWGAIAAARELFQQSAESPWHLALAEVVEAQLLHDRGERAAALERIRRAAAGILLYGDRERYVQARMLESSMRWDAGDQAAAAAVWSAVAEEALQRNDPLLHAHLRGRLGLFLLRHGDAGEAASHLAAARDAFDARGLPRQAVRARWSLAEAAAARGRYHEAVSDYRQVRELLLRAGDLRDAAIASAEILELLLLAGREAEVLPEADRFLDTFREAGLPLHALQAWTYVRHCARLGALTADDLAAVRRYFEGLPLRPNARFETAEPPR